MKSKVITRKLTKRLCCFLNIFWGVWWFLFIYQKL